MLSVLTSTHLLLAARDSERQRFFYSSSACVYAAQHQTTTDVPPLREEDAYPAMPEDGYGWEKLFTERMARHFFEDFGLADPRGPLSQRVRTVRHVRRWTGEGARCHLPKGHPGQVVRAATGSRSGATASRPAASCTSTTASTARSSSPTATCHDPLNIGSDEFVTINQLVDIAEGIAGITLKRDYKLDAPQGVRGRNSDNTRITAALGWAPSIMLEDGLEKTYRWIHDRLVAAS